eukprot:14008601-Ditylum_brightwellii.AAC.1
MDNFTTTGPRCSVLNIATDDIHDIDFDFDETNVYKKEAVIDLTCDLVIDQQVQMNVIKAKKVQI